MRFSRSIVIFLFISSIIGAFYYGLNRTNGNVDLQRAFDEVNRRASVIGCENFDCSFERFKGLATECGNCTPSTT